MEKPKKQQFEKPKKISEAGLLNEEVKLLRQQQGDPPVVNEIAYEKVKKLRLNPIFHEKSEVECSDGAIVTLNLFPGRFHKRIEHLPEEEQKQLEAKRKTFHSLRCRLNCLCLQAFGKGIFNDNLSRFKKGSSLDSKMEELLDLFGRMFSATEVHKIVVEEWKMPLTYGTILTWRKDHIEEITQRIETFKSTHDDTRLGTKRGRLEELIWLYQSMKEKYKKNFGVMEHRTLIGNIEQIRKEIEGDRITFTGNLDIQIESRVNQHLQLEVFKTVNLNQIILSRVAVKLGVDPLFVLSELARSYYANYLGLIGEEQDYEGVSYPTTETYDFDHIRGKVEKKESEEEQILRELRESSRVRYTEGLTDPRKLLKAKIETEKFAIQSKENLVDSAITTKEIKKEKKEWVAPIGKGGAKKRNLKLKKPIKLDEE